MNRLGLDTGPRNCGWAVEADGTIIAFGLRDFLEKGRDLDWEITAAEGFSRWLTWIVGKHGIAQIMIEIPFSSRHSPNIAWQHWSLIGTGLLCHRLGLEYRPVPGSAFKKFMTGKARATPKEMIESVRRAGLAVSNDHAADACAMLLSSRPGALPGPLGIEIERQPRL